MFIGGITEWNILAAAKADVQLNKSKVTLIEGKTVTLKVKELKGAEVISVKWQSKNKKIAMVSNKGKVTAKKEGMVNIKCTIAYKTGKISGTLEKIIACKVKVVSKNKKTNLLGGLSPEEALEYMKTTENLIIVEVNTAQWKKTTPFTGALWIPHDEMAERYDEIPEGCPVILHCGAGVVSVQAYETLIEKRSDIPELSYIDGVPPIKEYNEWLENH